jgi:hypothetical protein
LFTGNIFVYYFSIRNNKPLPVTAEEGKDVVEIIVKAFESSKSQKVEKVREPN